ncbi:interferon-induced 35 kDa protein [Genypterus blacodes]|uniref:interferon-induced 35 kDa protein n=1 Tax=Genypterus blacodes TaxID=154954 RepID=UPI003F76F966
MSSDEDFALVMETEQPETLEQIQALISKHKKQYELLIEEHKDLAEVRDERQKLAKEFRERSDIIVQTRKNDHDDHTKCLDSGREKIELLRQEEADLSQQVRQAKEDLKEQDANNAFLREKTRVFTAVPERKVVFKGQTGEPGAMQKFDIKSHIVYPMDGGTALVTFEEEIVAKKILSMGKHEVDLGAECRIFVEAKPIHLMIPSLVEIETEVCPRRILISNLPKIDIDSLGLNLEVHFSKTRNSGGEVDTHHMLHDSGTMVLTFVKDDVARNLIEMEHHDLEIKGTKHRVRVTPFLNGTIKNLTNKMQACLQTVLLTGIPDVVDQETLQDLLEIHFQKSTNGGGEIEALLYNPLGQHISAVFEGNTASCTEGGAAAL